MLLKGMSTFSRYLAIVAHTSVTSMIGLSYDAADHHTDQ